MKLVGHVTILWKIHCNWPLIDVFTMLPFLCLVKIFVLVFIPIAIVAITFFTVSGIGGGKSKSASVKLVDNQRICLTFFSDQVNWKEAVDRCAAYNQTLLRRELMDSYSDYISEHSNGTCYTLLHKKVCFLMNRSMYFSFRFTRCANSIFNSK